MATLRREEGARRVDIEALREAGRDDKPNRPEGWKYITVERAEEVAPGQAPLEVLWVAYWDADGNELRRDLEEFIPGSGFMFTRNEVE